MSDSFGVQDGQRTFITIDGDAVEDFKNSTDSGKYDAYLFNLDDMKADMSRKVGGLSKETSDNFDARLTSWDIGDPLFEDIVPPIVDPLI